MGIDVLESYERFEQAKEGNENLKVLDALNFLKDYSILDLSDMEIEMCVMHAAFLVSSKNTFEDNFNVSSKNKFIDHVSLIKESDASAWCRKLYEYNLWNDANRVIVNVLYNWMTGSFDKPERFIP